MWRCAAAAIAQADSHDGIADSAVTTHFKTNTKVCSQPQHDRLLLLHSPRPSQPQQPLLRRFKTIGCTQELPAVARCRRCCYTLGTAATSTARRACDMLRHATFFTCCMPTHTRYTTPATSINHGEQCTACPSSCQQHIVCTLQGPPAAAPAPATASASTATTPQLCAPRKAACQPIQGAASYRTTLILVHRLRCTACCTACAVSCKQHVVCTLQGPL
jgi:hypothetical protein